MELAQDIYKSWSRHSAYNTFEGGFIGNYLGPGFDLVYLNYLNQPLELSTDDAYMHREY